jgi:hypothetical protein
MSDSQKPRPWTRCVPLNNADDRSGAGLDLVRRLLAVSKPRRKVVIHFVGMEITWK